MEELLFEDYLKPNIKNQADAPEIITLTIKQISRCRFEISGKICKVKILLNGNERSVILANTITPQDIGNRAFICLTSEPSLEFLYRQTIGINDPLLKFLKDYRDQFYKLGTEYEGKYWYKLYSKTKIEDPMRESYQAGWIDYEKQLENSSIIYDESGRSGLWAMPKDIFLRSLNDLCLARYGDRVFILNTVPECRYVNDGKELIGDRFKVVEKYDLNSIEDISNIYTHLLETEKKERDAKIKERDAKISELYVKIRSLENENIEAIDNQIYLTKWINKCKLFNWLFFLFGILCGIVVCIFI